MANLHGIIGATNALSSFAKGYYNTKLKMLEMDQTESRWNKTFQMQKQTLKMNQAVAERGFQFEQQKYADGAELRGTQSQVLNATLATQQFNLKTAKAAKQSIGPASVELSQLLSGVDYTDPFGGMSDADTALGSVLSKYAGALDQQGIDSLRALHHGSVNSPAVTARSTLMKAEVIHSGGETRVLKIFKDGSQMLSEPVKDGSGTAQVLLDMGKEFDTQVAKFNSDFLATHKEAQAGFMDSLASGNSADAMLRQQMLIKDREKYVFNAATDWLDAREKLLISMNYGKDKAAEFVDSMSSNLRSMKKASDVDPALSYQDRVSAISRAATLMEQEGMPPYHAYRTLRQRYNDNLLGEDASVSLKAWRDAAIQRFGLDALEILASPFDAIAEMVGDIDVDIPATYDPSQGEYVGAGTGDIDLPPSYDEKINEAASGQWRHLKAKGAAPPIYLEKVKQAARGDWMNTGEWK